MFDRVHEMRTRIVTSPSFNGDRILGAILFVKTMDDEIEGVPTADYLWKEKRVVPFLKVDNGLAPADNGVQLMKPIPELDGLCRRARAKNVFGTKMRSVVKEANAKGVEAIVKQQFELGKRILGHGLVPILEPEVDIHSPDKAQAEALLEAEIRKELDRLQDDERIMLKLTLPEEDDLYRDLIEHPNVLKVVALSGGYSRDEANERLARYKGMVASFSRALVEGLVAQQSAEEFDGDLDDSIESIFQASMT
jgi:fructose-bisphosphate aldolase class I